MADRRIAPENITLCSEAQFGRHWECWTTERLSDVLDPVKNPEPFARVGDRFMAGDRIDLLRLRDEANPNTAALELATLAVVSAQRGQPLEIAKLGDTLVLDERPPEFRVVKQSGSVWEVFRDGKPLPGEVFNNESEASSRADELRAEWSSGGNATAPLATVADGVEEIAPVLPSDVRTVGRSNYLPRFEVRTAHPPALLMAQPDCLSLVFDQIRHNSLLTIVRYAHDAFTAPANPVVEVWNELILSKASGNPAIRPTQEIAATGREPERGFVLFQTDRDYRVRFHGVTVGIFEYKTLGVEFIDRSAGMTRSQMIDAEWERRTRPTRRHAVQRGGMVSR